MEKKVFTDSVEQILEVLATTAAIAIGVTKALDLPVTYLKEGKVIKEFPDGKVEVLQSLENLEDGITL